MFKNLVEMVVNSFNKKIYWCMFRICCVRQRDVVSYECGCGILVQVLVCGWCFFVVVIFECNNSVFYGVEDGGKYMLSIGDVKNCLVLVIVWSLVRSLEYLL